MTNEDTRSHFLIDYVSAKLPMLKPDITRAQAGPSL